MTGPPREDWTELAACVRSVIFPPAGPAKVAGWPDLLRLAEAHRLSPVLARLASRTSPQASPDSPTREALRLAADLASIRALGAVAALRHLAVALAERGIPCMAWKGAALSERAWGDPTLRVFDDIDLVVSPASRREARAVARALDWRSRHAMTDAQEEVIFGAQRAYELVRDGDPPLLELHWAFGARRYRGFPPIEDVLSRCETRDVAGASLPVPTLTDALHLHAVHATKHGWSTLEDVVVFAALARADVARTREASRQASEHGAATAFALGEALVDRVLGYRLLAPGTSASAAAAPRAAVDPLVARVLARWDDGQTTWRADLRWDLAWTARDADRVHLLAHSMFDPTLQEWNAVRLPSGLGPLYRVIRPVRLLARAIRR